MTVRVAVCVVWDDDERKGKGETQCRLIAYLLFTKSTKGAARLNVPTRWTNRYQQYYIAFSTYTLRKGLEFNPDL